MRIQHLPPGYIPKHCSNSPRSSAVLLMEDDAMLTANAGITPPFIGQRHFPGAHEAIHVQTKDRRAALEYLRRTAVDTLEVTA